MSSNSFDAIPKIGDFGFAVKLQPGESCSKRVGSKGYTAPEVLKGEPYDFKCDVFSFGCMLFAMVTADLPFLAKSMEDYFFKTSFEDVKFTNPEWKKITNEMMDLIKQMLIKDPKERPTMTQVLKHPWFSN